MKLNEILGNLKKPKKAKRLGRGNSAGKGRTSGRGQKGQNSRSGKKSKLGGFFAGGQTPIIRKLPKAKGFRSHRIKPLIITTDKISRQFSASEIITKKKLMEKGLIKNAKTDFKIIKKGKIENWQFSKGIKLSKSLIDKNNEKSV